MADNTMIKNRTQNIVCSFGCVARSTVLLKFVQHGPITIAIDGNGLFLLIFKEKWYTYTHK